MIQSLLLFALGFLIASAILLLFAPMVWKRAVELTTRRVRSALPQSFDEAQAQKDVIRAEYAMAQRRIEMAMDKAHRRMIAKEAEAGRANEDLRLAQADVERRQSIIDARDGRIEALESDLADRDETIETLRADLAESRRTGDEAAERLRTSEEARSAIGTEKTALEERHGMLQQENRSMAARIEELAPGERIDDPAASGEEPARERDAAPSADRTASLAAENATLRAEIARLRKERGARNDVPSAIATRPGDGDLRELRSAIIAIAADVAAASARRDGSDSAVRKLIGPDAAHDSELAAAIRSRMGPVGGEGGSAAG